MNKRTCALHEALFFVIFCGASFACYAASAGKVWAQVETSVVQVKYSMLRWDFVVPSDGESRSACEYISKNNIDPNTQTPK
eukprot:m.97762 g.97762  ORF g.97762 m.97762 type:complete len:81 (-) comp8678_c0_seq3:89-331(-)